ncbi:MAG: hypothetical protein EBS84_18545 [Proteobacteria bacterium]|nr:hypothetical protein [Pseudomonadota bacterium]
MTNDYDFHLLQLRYIREAMNDYANYRPDDWTVAMVDALIASARTVRTAFLNAKTDYDLAMGGRNSACTNLHPVGQAAQPARQQHAVQGVGHHGQGCL